MTPRVVAVCACSILALACTKEANDDAVGASPEAKAEATPPVAEPEPEPKPDKADEPEATKEAEPEPQAEPEAKPEPISQPSKGQLVDPRPGLTHWVELPGMDKVESFYLLSLGALVECGADKYCEIGPEDGLTRIKKISPYDYDEDPLGRFPDDFWNIVTDDREQETRDDIHFFNILSLRRWTGTGFEEQAKLEFEVDVDRDVPLSPRAWRRSHAGGLIIFDPYSGKVFNSESPSTPLTTRRHDEDEGTTVLGVFQTASGALSFLQVYAGQYSAQMYLTRPCPPDDSSCVSDPYNLGQVEMSDLGGKFEFIADVSHAGDALTLMLLEQATEHCYLLHYQPGRGEEESWLLEGIPNPSNCEMLWPDANGGLWLSHDDGERLLHRNAEGRWFEVDPPAGQTYSGDYAMRANPRELLALTEGEDFNLVAARGSVTPKFDPTGALMPIPPLNSKPGQAEQPAAPDPAEAKQEGSEAEPPSPAEPSSKTPNDAPAKPSGNEAEPPPAAPTEPAPAAPSGHI